MKTQSVDPKSRSKNTTALNFYNFKNNDFLKTNVFVNQAIHLKTSPDEVNFDQETYVKLIKNNQGISGSLNARKIPNKDSAPKTTRNSSTPLLLPLDLMKVKGSSPNIDLSPEPLQLSAKNALSNKISFSSPKPPHTAQTMSTLLTPTLQQPNSARTNHPRTPTESFTLVSPRGHQAKKSLFGMTPEEIQTLEKQILAKTKLDRDRTETISRLNTRHENKRDISYFSDRGAKSHNSGSQNQIMSPRLGSTQYVPAIHDLPPLTLRTTPEPVVVPLGQTSSEKTAQLTNSMSMKKNTDFTSIEEEGPESRDMEFPKRLHTASVVIKKNSIDYTIPTNLPPLALHKANVGSMSGLPSSSLNDYLFKAHNLASPVHQHHQGRTMKPSTAGSPDHKIVPRMFDSPRKKMLRIDSSDVKKMDTDDLLNEIRREVPSVLSQTPATRQDVMVLSNWMNSKIHQIAENATLKEEDKNLQYDRLYNICINEVFRQVSLECSERGELIHRIWSCYFQIFSQCKLNLEAEIQRLKAEHQKESQRQYEWHQKFIDKKDQELENCKMEIRKLLQVQEEEQKNMMKLMHKNIKYKQKIDQLKGVITVNKAQIEEVKDENRRYAKRLAYKIANNKRGTYVPTFLAQGQGGAKENTREASVPENLGVGSSLASPRKLTIPLTPTGFPGGPRFPSVRITTEEEKSDNSSDESSLDFVYEDTVTNAKQVFRIDHLNNNVVMHKKVEAGEDNPIKQDGQGGRIIRTCTKETQTNLALAESKYDGLLDTQKLVDELLTELKVKKEIDVLAEVDDIALPSIDLSRIPGIAGDLNVDAKQLRRTFSWQTMQSMQTRMMIEDRLDGLGKSNNTTPRSEFINSLKKKLFVGREGEAEAPVINGNADFNKMIKAVDGDMPKANHRRVPSDLQYKVIEEEKGAQTEAKGTQLKAATSPKNSNYLFVFEPIQEQVEVNEDGKSFVKSQSRIAKQSDEMPEQAEQPEEPEEPEEEDKKILLEGETEEQSTQFHGKGPNAFETPVAKFNPQGFESYQTTPRNNNTSITSDDLFHNLDQVAADFGDVIDRGTKYASQIGSIAETEKDNQNNSLDEKMQLEFQNKNDKPTEKPIDPFVPEEEPRRAFSLSTLINTKTHAMRMVSMLQAKREDVAIHDKAKLLTVVRMYKVEREKNKLMQNSVVELEEQLMNEKENQGKMKDNLDEMKVHIKMLEQLKSKCPHGKCSLCRGQEESEFEEGDNSRNLMDSSHNDKTSINNDGEREMDEVDEEENEDGENEEGEDEGEDGEGDGEDEEGGYANNGDGTTRKYHRQTTGKGFKKKKMKLTAAQQPQFAKKKEVNQNQIVSAAIAIINKVKDKKLTKFRNFMPIKSVLKNIHVLYSERINQAKENSIVKDEEFFVFVYKWFHNNFGFRKIAEQKYIIFLLSVKKYLHIVRINLFARFMSLLQGSSNFTADEFSKYLEGIEIIVNSTLGIPIVNSDTDSKYYVPFLRGLEYLRYFSENKMATEEYIEFKREFEALKEPDPKNINRNGIVDIDLFMTKVLNKYRIICNRTKQFVVNAFKAADLDANKYCSLKEFIIIYRNIDPDRFDQGFAENLFNEHADIKVQGEINLSFDKFTVVCVEYGLFTDLQQDHFLGIQNPQEMDELMQSIRNNWNMYYVEFDRKLNSASASQEDKAYWFSILKVLNERISDFEKLEANDIKPILIAYKILDKEVEKLLEKEVERDAYGVKIIKTTTTEP